MLLQRRQKLAQTAKGIEDQAKAFLKKNGFPVDKDYLKLFGCFIQNADASKDSFDPNSLAKAIRKQIANELVFGLIFPEKAKELDDAKAKKAIDDAKATEEVNTAMV